MSNPLVAERQDSTTGFSGVPLLESANDTAQAINSGDWASGVLGAAGTALDALSMALDPFGAIFAAGVGWLIEHVGPLSDALDALTGDPDQIKAHAQTWTNVSKELGAISADLASAIQADTSAWKGESADAYRGQATDIANLITAAQTAADGAASGVGTAGEVVAAVRTLVRDIIAELVGHMISWALQVVFTLGIGLAWVVPQVVAAVAKTAAKIAKITTGLVQAMGKLGKLLAKLSKNFDDVGGALKNIKPGKVDAPPTRSIDGPSGTPGSTTPSGSPGGGPSGSPGGGGPSGSPGGGGPTTPSGSTGPSGSPGGGGPSGSPGGGGPTTPSGSPGGGAPGTGGGPSTPPPAGGKGKGPEPEHGPSTSRGGPGADGPRDRAVPSDSKNLAGDPVDVATGEVVMTQTDLTLPGAAGEVVLSRTHLSSYRAGRWFGPSWASTVDQRLEVGRDRVEFYAEDGMVLVYPLPAGQPVLPLEGPRYPLSRTHDGYLLSTGTHDLHFAGTGGTMPLTAIEQNGSRTEIMRAADGAPTALRRDDGTSVQISTAEGRIVSYGPPGAAPLVRFGYNQLGQLTTIADFAGRPMMLDYDTEHRLVGWQERTGAWYRYIYDDAGRCVRAVGADGFYDAAFAYDTNPRATRHTDALGHTWTYRMNDAGQLVELIDPLGNSRRYTWSRYDQLVSQVDELGRETRYEYENGELATVTRPDGSVVRVAATADGQTRLQAGEGDSAVHRVVPAIDPFTTLPGSAMSIEHAAAPDPVGDQPVTDRSVRPENRDVFGRPQLVHTASGGAARLGWTAEGRRSVRVGPQGHRETWQYDAEGQVVEYRDAAGGVRRRTYGPFGLVMQDFDTAGARTTYTYDGELRLTSVTNPRGLVWRYTYDAAGRLVEETDYDGRKLTYTYDAAGQLRRMVNGLGQPTEYDYDLLGNLVERRTTEEVTRYAYDALGHLVLAENPESRVAIIRDERGRVIAETINGLGVAWDHGGTVRRRRTSSGVDSEWTFDEAGLPRCLRIAGHVVEFQHDQAEREVVRTVDGNVVLRRRFDAEDRLAAEDIAGVGQRTYGYRPDGKLAAVDDAARPWRFRFDQAGRISEAHGPAGVEQFAYDATGTITSAATPVLSGPRTYDGNALLTAGGTRYTGDAQGRITGRHRAGASWTYTWDQLDRMRAARTPDGALWTYHYDPLGRRFAKRRWVTGPDGEPQLTADTRLLWSGTDLVERVQFGVDGSARITTWERLWPDSRPVVQIERTGLADQGRFRTVITSPAGAPTELLDERGAVVWQDRSSLWGAALPGSGAAAMPLAFPGQYRDEETGLHYNVFRYYDPEIARYISQDPLGLAAAPNPVGYVTEPLLTGDPLGLVGSCGANGAPPNPKRPRPDDFDQHPDLKPPPAKKQDDSIAVNRMTKEEFEKFKPELDQMMRADKHYFWSGGYKQGQGDPNDPYLGSIEMKANQMARQDGGNTLEGLVADNRLKMPGWVDDKMMADPNKGYWSHGDGKNPDGTPMSNQDQKQFVKDKWDTASETFAGNSGKDTHVVFPDKPGSQTSTGIPNPNGDIYPYRRSDNVFDVTEYPRLEQNGIKVTEHNAETGATRPYQKPPSVKP